MDHIMKKSAASIIIILSVSILCACTANTEKDADIDVSAENMVDQSTESDSGAEAITEMEVTNGIEVVEQMEILLLQVRYCQAMTDADTDTMRELVSEDMTYTHMSGKKQTR